MLTQSIRTIPRRMARPAVLPDLKKISRRPVLCDIELSSCLALLKRIAYLQQEVTLGTAEVTSGAMWTF